MLRRGCVHLPPLFTPFRGRDTGRETYTITTALNARGCVRRSVHRAHRQRPLTRGARLCGILKQSTRNSETEDPHRNQHRLSYEAHSLSHHLEPSTSRYLVKKFSLSLLHDEQELHTRLDCPRRSPYKQQT